MLSQKKKLIPLQTRQILLLMVYYEEKRGNFMWSFREFVTFVPIKDRSFSYKTGANRARTDIFIEKKWWQSLLTFDTNEEIVHSNYSYLPEFKLALISHVKKMLSIKIKFKFCYFSDIFFNILWTIVYGKCFLITLHNSKLHNLIPWILTFEMKKNCSITLISSKGI